MSGEPVVRGITDALLEHLRTQLSPVPLGDGDGLKVIWPGSQEDYRLGLYLHDFEENRKSGAPQMVRISQEERRYPDLTLSLHYMVFANRKAAFNSMGAEDEILLLEAALRAVHCAPELSYEGGDIHISLQPLERSEKVSLWQSLSSPLQPAVYLTLEPVPIPSTRVLRAPVVKEVQAKPKYMETGGGSP